MTKKDNWKNGLILLLGIIALIGGIFGLVGFMYVLTHIGEVIKLLHP